MGEWGRWAAVARVFLTFLERVNNCDYQNRSLMTSSYSRHDKTATLTLTSVHFYSFELTFFSIIMIKCVIKCNCNISTIFGRKIDFVTLHFCKRSNLMGISSHHVLHGRTRNTSVRLAIRHNNSVPLIVVVTYKLRHSFVTNLFHIRIVRWG